MPLVKATLEQNIKTMLIDLRDDLDQGEAIDKYAAMMANAVDTYIRSATVVVTGTSISGGAVTGTGTIQ